jgi:two-component system chemotaxis response regulator CheY
MSGYRFDRLKVLVVDDNQHMRDLIAAILQGLGTKTVYKIATAEDAWKALSNAPCDLIFLDWVMDGMSGLELTQKIRTAPDTPNAFTPIVMLTGHTSAERVRTARDAGVNEFLAKPVSAKAIISRLISVIDHPRAFVRTKSYFGPCRRRRRDPEYDGPKRRMDETIDDQGGSVSANAA